MRVVTRRVVKLATHRKVRVWCGNEGTAGSKYRNSSILVYPRAPVHAFTDSLGGSGENDCGTVS